MGSEDEWQRIPINYRLSVSDSAAMLYASPVLRVQHPDGGFAREHTKFPLREYPLNEPLFFSLLR
jgi:hypothetical protein